jgi:hypothetical protein
LAATAALVAFFAFCFFAFGQSLALGQFLALQSLAIMHLSVLQSLALGQALALQSLALQSLTLQSLASFLSHLT